jgi:hypothetical protein
MRLKSPAFQFGATSTLGRHARARAERNMVWELLRRDFRSWDELSAKDFCELHFKELKRSLESISPGAPIERTVIGALQGLAKKGLIRTTRSSGGTIYNANVYIPEREILKYNYGRAMMEAQRLHLL